MEPLASALQNKFKLPLLLLPLDILVVRYSKVRIYLIHLNPAVCPSRIQQQCVILLHSDGIILLAVAYGRIHIQTSTVRIPQQGSGCCRMSIAAAVVLHPSRSSDAHSYVCNIQPIAVFLMHLTQPVHGREWESGFRSDRICSSCGLQQDNKRTHNKERCSRRWPAFGSIPAAFRAAFQERLASPRQRVSAEHVLPMMAWPLHPCDA